MEQFSHALSGLSVGLLIELAQLRMDHSRVLSSQSTIRSHVIVCLLLVITREWDSTTGLQRLRVNWVSKSQAWQRAGRAGRNAPGVCLRLYTDAEYDQQMALHPISQLASAPLSGVLLNLLAMGVKVGCLPLALSNRFFDQTSVRHSF